MVEPVPVELGHEDQVRNVLVFEAEEAELEVESTIKTHFSSWRRYFGNSSAMNKFRISAEMWIFFDRQNNSEFSDDFTFSSLSKNMAPFLFSARTNMQNNITYSLKNDREHN